MLYVCDEQKANLITSLRLIDDADEYANKLIKIIVSDKKLGLKRFLNSSWRNGHAIHHGALIALIAHKLW